MPVGWDGPIDSRWYHCSLCDKYEALGKLQQFVTDPKKICGFICEQCKVKLDNYFKTKRGIFFENTEKQLADYTKLLEENRSLHKKIETMRNVCK